MKLTLKAFTIPLMFYCTVNYAQLKTNITPNEFGQFYNNPFVCLSQKGSDNSIEAGISNISNVGRIKGINTSYLYAFISNKTKKSESKNSFGISIYNNTEGPFLYKRKIHLAYIRHQQLNKDWTLSGGFLLGIYNTGIKANEVVGGINANAFDGGTSLSLHNKSTLVGVSLNQFTSASVQPFSEIITLPSYLVFYGSHNLELSNQAKLYFDITKKHLVKNSTIILNGNDFGVGSRVLLSKLLVGVNYYMKGLNFIVGINEWNFGNHFIDFNISYYNSTNKLAAINPNKLQLSLIYKKK
jgi:hypothetical protein